MKTATAIVLFAGTMTFVNEWYQTKSVNWRVPVATLLLAAAFDGLSMIDNTTAIMLSVMVLIGAGVTEFNGKSAASTLADLFNSTTKTTTVKTG
jgi:cation transport ATPase